MYESGNESESEYDETGAAFYFLSLDQENQIREVRLSIATFLNRFNQLVEKYGFVPSFKALRKQYLDVCSNGDVLINELIKGLVSSDPEYYTKYMQENIRNIDFIKRLIDEYVMDTLEELDQHELDLPVFY
jgi:hypothetical protein